MKCEVWWAKWQLFHIDIYLFWTISNSIKSSWKRASLEPLQVKPHVMSRCNYFWCGTSVCVKSNWLQKFERITLLELTSSTQLCFKCLSAKCMKCECSKPTAKIPFGTQIFSIQMWTFQIMPILTCQQLWECNENLPEQVATILRKLWRLSGLNFQLLQSKLNLAIVS